MLLLPETTSIVIIADGIVPLLIGSDPADTWWGLLLLITASMVAIIKGGGLFTNSSVEIARITRIPPVIVGATVVSMTTSFPEFMVSLIGTLSGSAEFAVGNAIGSCLCNIGLIIGLCGIARGILVKMRGLTPGIAANRDMMSGPGMFMLGSCLLTCLFSLFDTGGAELDGVPARYGLSRWQAGILLVGMFWYLGYSVRTARLARIEASLDKSSAAPEFTWPGVAQTVGVFLIASVTVIVGSRLLVCNAEVLALRMGVPKLVLGLTLFAVGTSLPELSVSLIAILKGHEALGIGNIVGSNVLNICWVLATCALVSPLPIDTQTVFVDLPVMLLLTVLLLVLPWKSRRISAAASGLMLSIYLAHLIGITAYGILGR